jgi:pimeloyl-ACP methyl ester carboxylesterase
MRTAVALLLFVSAAAAQHIVETGELNGAKYRIDIPQTWNKQLVLYCHGYSPEPTDPDNARQNEQMRVFLDQGFAVARSGYVAGGWAVAEAVQDTEALRRHFVLRHGKPERTYITGHSMGGFLTMTIMERFPDVYDGGLPLCGPLAPASWFMEQRVFDLRVVFDYYFPGALPGPVAVPEDYRNTKEDTARILAMLDGAPEKAESLRRYSGIRTNAELAGVVTFWTFILKDLQQRSGGNAFDNRDTIYNGSSDDDALNEGVKRYAADPGADRFLRAHYEPTGRLGAPMLHLANIYDPLVPPWVPNRYMDLVERANNEELFVQQYVKTPGHCRISDAEIQAGFQQLRRWVEAGERPAVGAAESAP